MNPDDIINSYTKKLTEPPSLEALETEREETLRKAFGTKALAQLTNRIVAAYQILSDAMHKKRKVPASKITLLAGGLAYLALPPDLVCDAIPVVGLVDDGIVLTWIFAQCADLFRADKEEQAGERPSQQSPRHDEHAGVERDEPGLRA